MKLTFIVISMLTLTACNNSAKKTESTSSSAFNDKNPTTTAAQPYTWEQLEKMDAQEIADNYAKNLERKGVIIEGYLALTSTVYSSGTSIRCNLYPRLNQARGMHANLEFSAGSGNNQMEPLPKKYKTEDFRVRTDAGELMGEGSYVRITGALSSKNEDYVTIYINKVEKATPPAPDYSNAMELNPSTIGAADKKIVQITGTLEIPMFLAYITYYYPLNIKGTAFPAEMHFTANTRIGSGKSQMEPLPENYTANDMKLRDMNGAILPPGKKLKIVGMYEKSSSGDGGSIFVEQLSAAN